jgi:Zn-finger nucleic acid-binding protein
MREVSARARTGYLLALDQCDDCGGLWFDRWELFPLHHDEVDTLDPLDVSRFEQPVELAPLGLCPRCEVALKEFRDPNLPPDAEVARCRVCEGMWLQRGQLRKVKKVPPAADRGARGEDEALVALARSYAHEASWSNVRELDAATYETEEPPPGLDDVGDAVKSTLPWIALQVLFRLLLRR